MGLTTLSIGLLVAAVGTIGYPFYTNLYQQRVQERLDRQIASPEPKQDYLDRNVDVGDSLTRLIIPAIEVDVVVVEGTTASAPRAGPAPHAHTPLPCAHGHSPIAGPPTTHRHPSPQPH